MKWHEIDYVEGIPPEDEYVLVRFANNYIGIACRFGYSWAFTEEDAYTIFKGKNKDFTFSLPFQWMPLPNDEGDK